MALGVSADKPEGPALPSPQARRGSEACTHDGADQGAGAEASRLNLLVDQGLGQVPTPTTGSLVRE